MISRFDLSSLMRNTYRGRYTTRPSGCRSTNRRQNISSTSRKRVDRRRSSKASTAKNSALTYIDLFAGCGGLSYGMMKAGWTGMFAIEKSDMAFSTLRHNLIDRENHFHWPRWLPVSEHNINSVLRKYRQQLVMLRGKVPLVVGGPPCQGFSTEGKRQRSDPRNTLCSSYLRFVELVQPDILLFENVRGFTIPFDKSNRRHTSYSNRIIDRLKSIGYSDASADIVNFSRFGVPQRRERFILVATRKGNADTFFELLQSERKSFLLDKGISKRPSTYAAISDLERRHGTVISLDSPSFEAGTYGPARTNFQKLMRQAIDCSASPDSHRYAKHTASTTKAFKTVIRSAKPNVRIQGGDREKYGLNKRNTTLLDEACPAPTLMSIPDDYVHYCEPRILTVREYARIQSFPDCFEFRGSYTTGGLLRRKAVPRYTQIGNAVPPLFAEFAGRILRRMVNDG